MDLGARASATIPDGILSIIEVYHGQRVQIGIFSTFSNKFWMRLSVLVRYFVALYKLRYKLHYVIRF